MKTIGEVLKSAREKHGLAIAQIAGMTKIQPQFIEALENNQFSKLPETTFVKGFIRNYALSVGKDPTTLLAIFRRDYGQDAKGKVIPRGLISPVNRPKLQWTPRVTVVAALTLIITLFSAYVILQFRSLSGTPALEVIIPQEGAIVSALVSLEGTTNPHATLSINNQPVAVSSDGKFYYTIGLSSGEHTITIEAKLRNGQTKVVQRTVHAE